jgi:Glycosyltransferase family 87
MGSSDESGSDDGTSHRFTRWRLPLSNSQSRAAGWILIGFYLAGLAISVSQRSQSDFVIYRNAGIHAAQRIAIYDFHDPSPFQYAPVYAVAFIALGRLPLRLAQLLWFLVSIALALPAMIAGTSQLLFGAKADLRGELIIIPVLLCARFIEPNFDHGQINLLLVAMIVWGLAYANESNTIAASALLAASVVVKPFALPVILYLLSCRRVLFVISLLFFVIALLWLPSVFVGTGYALHETTEYLRSLSTRVPHLSHDLHNKYNQSAAAIAVRLFAANTGRGLISQRTAAAAGFAFQLALSLAVIVWLVLRPSRSTGPDARLSLAALFCPMAAFSPVSWLEYYMALVVPYMALTFIACSDSDTGRVRAWTAQLVLAGSLILNLSTRLYEPLLYYGAEYFGSLAVLAAVVALSGTKSEAGGTFAARAGGRMSI